MKFFCILLSVLAMVGCVSVEDSAHMSAPTDPPPTTSTSDTRQLSVPANEDLRVIDLPSPHQHAVEIQFKNGVSVIRRSEIGSEKFEELVIPPGKSAFSDTQVLEGKSYSYILGAYVDGEFKSQNKLEAVIPKDLVIEKDLQNTAATTLDWTEFKRIYFQPSVQVFTYGADLKINADLVVFNETTIASFPHRSKSASQQPARHGGAAEITTKAVTGFVQFELNGEDGFDGEHGTDHDNPADDGREGAGIFSFNEVQNQKDCDVKLVPTNGKDGTLVGGNGTDGGNGGNSGALQLTFTNDDHFRFSLKSHPGLAGQPGRAGHGQKGGAPGQWRTGINSCSNNIVTHGGSSASEGRPGNPANDGRALANCILRLGQTPVCQ